MTGRRHPTGRRWAGSLASPCAFACMLACARTVHAQAEAAPPPWFDQKQLPLLVALIIVCGLIVVAILLSRHGVPFRIRRLAALGYLAGHPGPDTTRLLGEYVAWERHPLLQRRARAIQAQAEYLFLSREP